jgi:hypothetical protein
MIRNELVVIMLMVMLALVIAVGAVSHQQTLTKVKADLVRRGLAEYYSDGEAPQWRWKNGSTNLFLSDEKEVRSFIKEEDGNWYHVTEPIKE